MLLNHSNLIGLALASSLAMDVQANSSAGAGCEQQWAAESSRFAAQVPPDYAGLLHRWLEIGPSCRGSVAYEARLAMAYVFNQRLDQAQETLVLVANTPSPYRYLVELAQLHLDGVQLSRGSVDGQSAQKMESKLRAFVKKYPSSAEGQGMLGGVLTGLDKHADAIKPLETSLRSPMDLSGSYRNLTVSYAAVGRFNDAMVAADKAMGLDRALTSDQYFAYAVAKANAAMGKLKEAEIVLTVIAAKKPKVRSDPEFKAAVDFVSARMKSNP